MVFSRQGGEKAGGRHGNNRISRPMKQKILIISVGLELIFETYLQQALGSEARLGKHGPRAVEVNLSADRHNLEGEVGLVVAVKAAGLHVAYLDAETQLGIELHDGVLIISVAAVEHDGMIGDVAVLRASLGGG